MNFVLRRVYDTDETIAAIATAPGGSARGIVRLSGPEVVDCVAACFLANEPIELKELSRPCVISGLVHVKQLTVPYPCDLYLWPTSRSYTRQPVAELHTFGSPPLLEVTLAALCASGARLAEPGEFTLRAFLAGRLDLTQAEAVLGVIDASTRKQLDVALQQLAGGIVRSLTGLRDELLDLLAHLEAGLDFVEEDIQFITGQRLADQLDRAVDRIRDLAEQMFTRSQTSPAVRVVLTGKANVGKSSLFNALTGRAAAITSKRPGTTRDYLCVSMDLDGVACELVDTAGVDGSQLSHSVASAAQEITRSERSRADVRLLCIDGSRPLCRWEREQLTAEYAYPQLIVLTKADIPRESDLAFETIETSSRTGHGIDRLRSSLRSAAREVQRGHESLSGGSVVAETAVRCRESLRLASGSLDRARKIHRQDRGEELVAAEIRIALTQLGIVVGDVYTDDLLDRIFSRFCIGK